jgi:DNA-binding HxlR family transcriptional regulator
MASGTASVARTLDISGTAPSRAVSPVETTAALLRNPHTPRVVWQLFFGPKRFYQLVRELEDLPRRAVAVELEHLERAGVVARRSPQSGPARIEYQLTPIVVGTMYEWGLLARQAVSAAPVGIDSPEPAPFEAAR